MQWALLLILPRIIYLILDWKERLRHTRGATAFCDDDSLWFKSLGNAMTYPLPVSEISRNVIGYQFAIFIAVINTDYTVINYKNY